MTKRLPSTQRTNTAMAVPDPVRIVNYMESQGPVSSEPFKPKHSLEYMRSVDNQRVRGIFRNYETPGGELKFPWRQYKKDDIVFYTFKDGHQYEIPLNVANHLNNDCYVPVHEYALDSAGRQLPDHLLGRKQYRFGFVSTDLRPIEGWQEPSNIVTAIKVPDIATGASTGA